MGELLTQNSIEFKQQNWLKANIKSELNSSSTKKYGDMNNVHWTLVAKNKSWNNLKTKKTIQMCVNMGSNVFFLFLNGISFI